MDTGVEESDTTECTDAECELPGPGEKCGRVGQEIISRLAEFQWSLKQCTTPEDLEQAEKHWTELKRKVFKTDKSMSKKITRQRKSFSRSGYNTSHRKTSWLPRSESRSHECSAEVPTSSFSSTVHADSTSFALSGRDGTSNGLSDSHQFGQSQPGVSDDVFNLPKTPVRTIEQRNPLASCLNNTDVPLANVCPGQDQEESMEVSELAESGKSVDDGCEVGERPASQHLEGCDESVDQTTPFPESEPKDQPSPEIRAYDNVNENEGVFVGDNEDDGDNNEHARQNMVGDEEEQPVDVDMFDQLEEDQLLGNLHDNDLNDFDEDRALDIIRNYSPHSDIAFDDDRAEPIEIGELTYDEDDKEVETTFETSEVGEKEQAGVGSNRDECHTATVEQLSDGLENPEVMLTPLSQNPTVGGSSTNSVTREAPNPPTTSLFSLFGYSLPSLFGRSAEPPKPLLESPVVLDDSVASQPAFTDDVDNMLNFFIGTNVKQESAEEQKVDVEDSPHSDLDCEKKEESEPEQSEPTVFSDGISSIGTDEANEIADQLEAQGQKICDEVDDENASRPNDEGCSVECEVDDLENFSDSVSDEDQILEVGSQVNNKEESDEVGNVNVVDDEAQVSGEEADESVAAESDDDVEDEGHECPEDNDERMSIHSSGEVSEALENNRLPSVTMDDISLSDTDWDREGPEAEDAPNPSGDPVDDEVVADAGPSCSNPLSAVLRDCGVQPIDIQPQVELKIKKEEGSQTPEANNCICLSDGEEEQNGRSAEKAIVLSDDDGELYGFVHRRKRPNDEGEEEKGPRKRNKLEVALVSSEQEEARRRRQANRSGNVSGVVFVEDVHEAEAKGLPVVVSMCLDVLEDGCRLELPERIVRRLRYHQAEALVFMYNSMIVTKQPVRSREEDKDVGMILGHCMGLGKTMVCIMFIQLLSLTPLLSWKVERVMIIAPVSVVQNWYDEFNKWIPEAERNFDIDVITSSDSKSQRLNKLRRWAKPSSLNVMIMGHDMFRIMAGTYEYASYITAEKTGPTFLIMDEAHKGKRKEAQITQVICSVPTQRRVAVTGTPMQNNFGELYNLICFVRHGSLGTEQAFQKLFMQPIKDGISASANLDQKKKRFQMIRVLRDRVSALLHHRGIEFLEDQIPPKREFAVYFRLTAEQCQYYEAYLRIVRGQHLTCKQLMKASVLLSNLAELSRVWTHLPLLDIRDKDTEKKRTVTTGWHKTFPDLSPMPGYHAFQRSPKFQFVIDLVREAERFQDKVIVFHHSLDCLELLTSIFERMGRTWHEDQHLDHLPHALSYRWSKGQDYDVICGMDGGAQSRALIQTKFNNPKEARFRLLFVTIGAGSTGMTLVGANRVVLFDVDWNPSNDRQALHRAYRIGQQKEVYVYRLISQGTMEECVYKVQYCKDLDNETFFNECDIQKQFTEEECRAFYSLDQAAYDPSTRHMYRQFVDDDECLSRILFNRPADFVRVTRPDLMLQNTDEESAMSPEEVEEAHREYERAKQLLSGFMGTPLEPRTEQQIEESVKVWTTGIDDTSYMFRLRQTFDRCRKANFQHEPVFNLIVPQVNQVREAVALFHLYQKLEEVGQLLTPLQKHAYGISNAVQFVDQSLQRVAAKTKRFPSLSVKFRHLFTRLYTELNGSDPKLDSFFNGLRRTFEGIIG